MITVVIVITKRLNDDIPTCCRCQRSVSVCDSLVVRRRTKGFWKSVMMEFGAPCVTTVSTTLQLVLRVDSLASGKARSPLHRIVVISLCHAVTPVLQIHKISKPVANLQCFECQNVYSLLYL